jgi:phosphatidylserine/phosphatidylglycerophosphate/cardiolipin synthase-like enzyme
MLLAPHRTLRGHLLVDEEHYTELVQRAIERAKVSVWIATANVKDMRVEAPVGTAARARGRYVSLIEIFAGLVRRGVEVKILHSARPSGPFRAALARLGRSPAAKKVLLRQCPRVHMKVIAVDGALLYVGSANFTGAGLGAKREGRRNFEVGFVTDDDVLLDAAQSHFFRIWSGGACAGCKLRRVCPKPIDQLDKLTSGAASPRTSGNRPSPRRPSSPAPSA